jgi:hypothetical protein
LVRNIRSSIRDSVSSFVDLVLCFLLFQRPWKRQMIANIHEMFLLVLFQFFKRFLAKTLRFIGQAVGLLVLVLWSGLVM